MSVLGMTPMEGRGLLRGAVLLVTLSLIRLLLTVGGESPLLPGGEADRLPDLLTEAREVQEREARRARPLGSDETVDPNRSSEEDLDRLPGVGPHLAGAIIRYRAEGGGFRRPEDLLGVPGVGPATLSRIRPYLDFSGGVPMGLRPPPGTVRQVDLNRAGPEELQRLPGIGPALAERIVESRSEDGPFRVPEDLLRVRGIGPATLERLRTLVRLGR